MTDSALASPAAAAFDSGAAAYEAQRRRLVPPYDDFYGIAVEALELAGRPLERILDLGAGTGLLARAVAAAHPDAALTLFDGAPAMLDRARAAFAGRAAFVTGDLAGPLPPGPWDAVVSALAIHHLEDGAKQALFGRIHAALAPGGVFVNAEQVSGPTALFDGAYADWHHAAARRLGASDGEWAGYERRREHDRWAPAGRQLQWLRAAGFADADCLFKRYGFAVLAARRAPATGSSSGW